MVGAALRTVAQKDENLAERIAINIEHQIINIIYPETCALQHRTMVRADNKLLSQILLCFMFF